MQKIKLGINGAFIIKPPVFNDERGVFIRNYCSDSFAQLGIENNLSQISTSLNYQAGTIRGLHYQTAPYMENKIVACLHGKLLDVILDVRPDSSTYGKCEQINFSYLDNILLYIPQGCAHGFTTLEDNTQLLYLISANYQPEFVAGYNWYSPALNLPVLIDKPIISARDSELPHFVNNTV